MTALACIASLMLAASVFNRIDIPLPVSDASTRREAAVIPANANNDTSADVLILNGYDLTAYEITSGAKLWALRFDPGVSAFDIADLDLDGYPEVIAVRGNEVVRYATQSGAAPEAVTLFEQASLFADAEIQPYPHVLVTERQGQILIGLLMESGLELFTTTGTRTERVVGADTAEPGEYLPVFSAWAVDPLVAANRNGIEWKIIRSIEYQSPPDAGDESLPERRGTVSQARHAAEEDTEYWPWFSIQRDDPDAFRALYASTGAQYDTTQVRIRQIVLPDEKAARPGATQDAIKISPPRRFPGTLIVTESGMPDFNGDGYNDMLLWKAKTPGTSVDSLARAAAAGVWSIRLTTHLFAPTKQQYAAQVAGMFTLDVPLAWLLEMENGAPLRHLVLSDFNGDGKTDLACATGERSYAAWVFDNGFAVKPDFTAGFSSPIREVAFSADVNGDGRTAIGLRTADALHVLQPLARTKP